METADATQRFHEFIWPHRAAVLRAAQIQTGNLAEAEDLTQDTLLKAFKAIESFRDGTDPKSWLFRILRNARIDRLRANALSKNNVNLDALNSEPVAPESEVGLEDETFQHPQEILNAFSDSVLIDALQSVSEDLRWTLLLVDVEGLDQIEAAGILGVPVGTVKSRIHRGRAQLRQVLLPLARDLRLVRE